VGVSSEDWGKNDNFFLNLVETGVWQVTPEGRIWSNLKQEWVFENKGSKRYIGIEGKDEDGVVRYSSKHRLVHLVHNGPIPTGHQVNHKNGDTSKNNFENLEACTPSENTQHAHDTGLKAMPKGEASTSCVLLEKDVELIKSRYDVALQEAKLSGKQRVVGKDSTRGLAREFGVSHQLVSSILRGTRRT
jgi:beta-xylosidase